MTLRLENLVTSNGPDLRVYLSQVPAGGDVHAYRSRFIDLGPLKGNRGSQNCTVPAGTDLSKFKSAVIWCRRSRCPGHGCAPCRIRTVRARRCRTREASADRGTMRVPDVHGQRSRASCLTERNIPRSGGRCP
ncbi:MAG: DM13 domain-containing protein [Micromonosporaceae bacterium]